jgi:hypothetical protein
MARTKISEFSATPANNTDIDSINLAEGCAPSGINDAIRELMAQLKDFQTGAVGDSFNGPVGTTTAAAGAFTTLSASSTVTLSGGTANGVTYLNGSKVLTSGSALTFDGTNLSSTGGATFQGSPTGYSGGEVRLGPTTADVQSSVSTQATGSPILFFDHRGTSNTGIFAWRNSSGGASELMRLTSTGLGIGTSSPAEKLSVAGNIRLNGNRAVIFQQDSGVATGALSFRNSSGTQKAAVASYYNVADEGNLEFIGPSGSTNMLLNSSGNLGLGVTPSASWASGTQSFQFGPSSALYNPGSGSRAVLASNAIFTSGVSTATYITSNAAAYYDQDNGSHKWNIAPSGTAGNAITFSQVMTLDASGNLLVGKTGIDFTVNGAQFLSGAGGSSITSTSVACLGLNLLGSDGTIVGFYKSSSAVGSISVTTTATAYNTSSDYRLKNTIAPMTGALAKVAQLKPCTYKWNADGSDGQGFIAHELAEVVPQCVTGEKDAVDEEGNPKYQGIDTSFLVATLTAALQEAHGLIKSLEARVVALEAK